MASSPYIPVDIKEYIRKFQIQQTINQSVNSLLKQKPQDPYSYLIGILQKKSIPDVQVNDIKMIEVISGEGFPVIKLKVSITYLNQQQSFYIDQPIGISSEQNNVFHAEGLNGKGMKTGIQLFNEHIRPIIKQKKYKCSEQEQIDSQLSKVYKNQQRKGLYQINTISFAINSIKSRIFSTPLHQIYSELSQHSVSQGCTPQFMINCLHGGKTIGSKCRIFKYYLITKSKQGVSLIQATLQNVKKSITSGKGGEAALKYSPDGTFICPLDTIMDNLKIVEDAINTVNGKQHLSIGLSWMADTLFNNDSKKYELQNVKTPFDNDQMIDYLIKLLTDKPIISYMQDPLASAEVQGWVKLKNKIKQTQAIKSVKIGSRNGNLLKLNSDQFKQKLHQLSTPVNQDTHPDLSIQERQAKNLQKLSIDYLQIRAFDCQTVTKLIGFAKQLKKTGTTLILQDNSFETYNTDLVDICYGIGAYCSLGSVVKFDRLSKINRALQIIRELEKKEEANSQNE